MAVRGEARTAKGSVEGAGLEVMVLPWARACCCWKREGCGVDGFEGAEEPKAEKAE